MFDKFFSFISGSLSEANGDASSKRLAMLSTIFTGLLVFILSFWLGKEIPGTAMTLIQTLIATTTATYTITRWKEDGKIESIETKSNSQDE